MTSCPSCGFVGRGDAHEAAAQVCSRCGRRGPSEGIAAVYGAVLLLLGCLTLVVGILAWGMPAGTWLVLTGGVLSAVGVALIWKGTRSSAR